MKKSVFSSTMCSIEKEVAIFRAIPIISTAQGDSVNVQKHISEGFRVQQ